MVQESKVDISFFSRNRQRIGGTLQVMQQAEDRVQGNGLVFILSAGR